MIQCKRPSTIQVSSHTKSRSDPSFLCDLDAASTKPAPIDSLKHKAIVQQKPNKSVRTMDQWQGDLIILLCGFKKYRVFRGRELRTDRKTEH